MTFAVSASGTRQEIAFDDGGVNRLTRQRLQELREVLREIPGGMKLLVFRSSREGIFAAGADMAEMQEFDGPQAESFAREGQELMAAIQGIDCATAGVIDGDCLGGALDLALAFDVRITTARGRFAHPGARLGIMTGFGGTSRLPRRLGTPAAGAVLLGGKQLDAAGAVAAGVADFLVDDTKESLEPILAACESASRRIVLARRLAAAAPALDDRQLSLLGRRLSELAQYD